MFLNIDEQEKNSVALRDNEGYSLTYGQLAEEIVKMKKNLPKRCVAFCLCKNTAGGVLGYLAMVDAGVVPLMLNKDIDEELFLRFYDLYSPTYLWVPKEMEEKMGYRNVYETRGYCLLETKNRPYLLNPELQLLMTTSGSTGSPKVVRYKKGNLETNAKNVAKAFDWTSKERAVCDLGIQYTMGLNVVNTHLYVGAEVLLTTYNLMSSDFWDYVKRERATNFTGVPFSYEILSRLHFSEMDLPELTTLSQGGGKLTGKRFKEYVEYAQKNEKRFIASFGTTETSARMSVLPPQEASKRTGSIGKAIPEGELFLIDEEGNVQEESESEGELCYRGPNVTMGYAYDQNDLSREDDWKGEYHTGDLARRDEDGFYYITGRKSRFLKLLSYRVSLDQCENLIREQFGIDCACAGTDQQMKIYTAETGYAEKIIDFISQKTGLYRALFKVTEGVTIFRNATGKIEYEKFKDQEEK